MKKIITIFLICCLVFALTFSLSSCGDNNKETQDTESNKTIDSTNSNDKTNKETDCAHVWKDATCLTPKTCTVCKATEGEALGHDIEEDDGNCLTPIVCPTCNAVLTAGKNEHIAHADDSDCTTPVLCTVCNSVVTAAKTHDFSGEWQKSDDGHNHVCQNVGCTAEDTKIAHSGGEATCSGVYCEVCKYRYDTATNPEYHEISLIAKNGKCLCGEVFEAAVGKTFYSNFNDALSNWTDGTTLTLLADVTHTNSITISNKSVTLDLNGRSYSRDGNAFTVNRGASLTITDTSADKNGSITHISEKNEPTIWLDGTLNILGGTISSYAQKNSTVYVHEDGKLTMSGGTVEQLGNSSALLLWENTTSVISGGIIADEIHSYGTLTIKDQAMITSEKAIYWTRGTVDLSQAKNAEGWNLTVWKNPMTVGIDILLPDGMELQVDNITTNAAEKDVITTIRHPHVGGTASCTVKAVCDICSEPYGTFLHSEKQSCKINEADYSKHDYYYPCCGALANTEEHTLVDGKCVCGMISLTIEQVSINENSLPLGNGWQNEIDLRTIKSQDIGKIDWDINDQIIITFTSVYFGEQYGTLTYDGLAWSNNVSFSYLNGEAPTVSAIYAPCFEIADGKLQLKDGMQIGTMEYISSDYSFANGELNISFESANRNYSRLHIIGLPNQELTVSTTDFAPAGGTKISFDSYTLTTDKNGNAYLYGTFTETATVLVKSGEFELAHHTFTESTANGISYALDARPIIDGTLGGKTEATEDDINALVEQLKAYVDNGITTIIVTGEEPAIIEVNGFIMPAASEAIYRLTGSGYYNENNPYNGKIDLILADAKKILEREFAGAYALKSINLPNVTTVGNGAFYGCEYLEKLTFGSVVTSINQSGRVVFYRVGRKVEGCELVLNCGQLQAEDTYKPNLENNVWFKPSWGGDVTWKSITLTHTGSCDECKAAE